MGTDREFSQRPRKSKSVPVLQVALSCGGTYFGAGAEEDGDHQEDDGGTYGRAGPEGFPVDHSGGLGEEV